MTSNLVRVSGHVLLASLVLACGGTASPPPQAARSTPAERPTVVYARAHGYEGAVHVRFSVPEPAVERVPESLFDTPWPTEMARGEDGRVDLAGFPGRHHFAVAAVFEESALQIRGFSVAPVIYFSFGGAVDDARLGEFVDSGSIRLMDVDERSPTRGARIPLRHHVHRGASRVPDGTLALRPSEVLRPDNLYLALVLRKLAPDAPTLGTTDDFERIKGTLAVTAPALERARLLHADAFAWLRERGVARADVAAVALFRTQPALDPVKEVIAAVEQLPAARPKLLAVDWMQHWDGEGYRTLRGYYCTANFQTGVQQAPFVKRGGIIEAADGRARVSAIPNHFDGYVAACAGRLRARFVLTVPDREMPVDGWPLLVYAHGTTGDATSVLGHQAFAGMAARAGMAAVSTDQPLHGSLDARGARPGSDTSFVMSLGPFPIPLPLPGKGGELAFYNALRPAVLRDNLRQAIADGASLARLMLDTDFATAKDDGGGVALSVRSDVPSPRFNAKRGYVAAGHSQGSQSMAALGALDPRARATLLSACGGDFSSVMLLREDGKRVRRIVELVLGLSAGELNEFHPFATVMQTMLDPVDPQTFGALYRTPAGTPRSALLVSGVGDSMTPDGSGVALARAMGLVPLAPGLLPVAGQLPQRVVSANGAGGRATLAVLQIAPSYAYEPHFVAFREPVAAHVIERYLAALAGGALAPKLWIGHGSPAADAR